MKTPTSLALALAFLAPAAGLAHAAEPETTTPAVTVEPVASAPEALARIAAGGYYATHDLAFRHGLWTAEATTLDGLRVDVVVDAVSGAIWAGGSTSTPFLSAAQVRERLVAAGYTQIEDLEFDDGVWEAEARNGSGQRVDLIVHPVTGAILSETPDGGAVAPVGLLTAAQIRAALEAAGYTQIRDLEFDDGYWEADARNRQGQRVELTIDPRTAAILREERD